MPIYTYKCECGNTVVATHSITEDPKIECSNCRGLMRRIPQAPQVTFNGTGFYSTDKKR